MMTVEIESRCAPSVSTAAATKTHCSVPRYESLGIWVTGPKSAQSGMLQAWPLSAESSGMLPRQSAPSIKVRDVPGLMGRSQ